MDEHLEADYEDRVNGGVDVDEEEDEDGEIDWEMEQRKRDFLEFSQSHPDMAFTGESVHNHIYDGGDLESAGMDDPFRGEY